MIYPGVQKVLTCSVNVRERYCVLYSKMANGSELEWQLMLRLCGI